MTIETTVLILVAAALHAGWNTLIKINGDRVAVMAIVTFAGSLLSLTALPFVASPDASSFPLLLLTILIHTGYHFFLPVAYDHGDLGQVYRSEEHTSELQSLMRVSYAIFCLKKK